MTNVETYDTTADKLSAKAIREPTPENINNAVNAHIDNAHKMTEYIKYHATKS